MTTRRNNYGPPRIFKMAPGGSTTHTNTTDAATIASIVLPAGSLRTGDTLRISAVVEADAADSTDTQQVLMTCTPTGGTLTQFLTGAAVDVGAGEVCVVDGLVEITAAGGAGTGRADGYVAAQWSTTSAVRKITPVSSASNWNTLVDNTIGIQVDHSVAAAANQTTVRSFMVEIIPAVV